ncbi:aspartate aminotransferase [Gluconacetobacter sacchari DSM 12717]|nr:aspartate aminotransferase [Gluconacetobacter sacchari DSM 12717]
MSPLKSLPAILPDPLLQVAQLARLDRRPEKIDLTIGVYRDQHGQTPVLESVKSAEKHLLETERTKSYLSTDGVEQFCEEITGFLLPRGEVTCSDIVTIQAVGGTGALSLAAEFLCRFTKNRTVWVPVPAWSNHVPVMERSGLTVRRLGRSDSLGRRDFPAFMRVIRHQARPGDIILLQPGCHNPTGDDWTDEEWSAIADACIASRLIPILDVAYHGLGRGLHDDISRVHRVFSQAEIAFLSYSCSKNFSLYRERVGALIVGGLKRGLAMAIHPHLSAIARAAYSMPPSHGGSIVGHILANEALRRIWIDELADMQNRLGKIRSTFACHQALAGRDLRHVADGHGMFTLLPLSEQNLIHLRKKHAIYIPSSGRINLAGLNAGNLSRFAYALSQLNNQSAVSA